MENHDQLYKMFSNIHIKIRQDLDKGILDCDSAVTILTRHIDVCTKFENNKMLSNIYDLLGEIELYRHNNLQALSYYEKSIEYAYKIGEDYIIAIRLNNFGETTLHLGLYSDAVELLKKAREYASKAQNNILVVITYVTEARAKLELGKSAEAIFLANKAREVLDNEDTWSANLKDYLPHLYAVLGMAYADVGHAEFAWKYVERANQAASGFSDKTQLYIAKMSTAHVQLAYPAEGIDTLECLDEAIAECQKFGKQIELIQLLTWKSEYLTDIDQIEEAKQIELVVQNLMEKTNYRSLDN